MTALYPVGFSAIGFQDSWETLKCKVEERGKDDDDDDERKGWVMKGGGDRLLPDCRYLEINPSERGVPEIQGMYVSHSTKICSPSLSLSLFHTLYLSFYL